MTHDQRQPIPAMTPAKLVTIAILAIVLVVVLVVQFAGSSALSVSLKKRASRNSSNTAGASTASGELPPIISNRIRWPDIQREEVLAFNPFAIPDSMLAKPKTPAASQPSEPIQVAQSADSASASSAVQAAGTAAPKDEDVQARIRAQERKSRIKRIRATAAALQQQGVSVVMNNSSGAVARIGEQEVRVGDVINGVLRVVEITPQGIVIEEAPEESPETKSD